MYLFVRALCAIALLIFAMPAASQELAAVDPSMVATAAAPPVLAVPELSFEERSQRCWPALLQLGTLRKQLIEQDRNLSSEEKAARAADIDSPREQKMGYDACIFGWNGEAFTTEIAAAQKQLSGKRR